MLTGLQEPKKGGFEISLATDSDRLVVKFLPPQVIVKANFNKSRRKLNRKTLRMPAVAEKRMSITYISSPSSIIKKKYIIRGLYYRLRCRQVFKSGNKKNA